MECINLYEASDYREYLRAVAAAEQSESKTASLETLAAKLCLGTSTFKMVLKGSRGLTIETIHAVATGLGLCNEDRDFFEALVLRDQSESDIAKDVYNRRLAKLREARPVLQVRAASATLIDDWLLPALAVYLLDIEQVEKRVFDRQVVDRTARAFDLPTAMIDTAIERLKRSGFLQAAPQGTFHCVVSNIARPSTRKRYLKKVLSESARRLDESFADRRALYSVHAFSIERAAISDLHNDYRALMERYIDRAHADPNHLEILQVSMQALPLTGNTLAKETSCQDR